MPFTLGGFGEDLDVAGTEQNLAALADNHLTVAGDNLRVPELDSLIAVMGGLGSGGAGLLRLEAPSIRDDNRLVVSPLNGLADADVETNDPISIMDFSMSPRRLEADENLTVRADSNTSAAAFQYCLCWFSDGRIAPVTPDQIITVRATNGDTLTARAWTQGALTLADSLLVGRYQILGMRYQGASGIAARLVFKGSGTTNWRPGCPGLDTQVTNDHPLFRYGRMGVWGEFNQINLPDVEFLADLADTSQVVDLDLVRLG